MLAALTAACGGCGCVVAQRESGSRGADVADLPFPVHLTARQSKGRQIFDEACASCHGRAGRGDSARAPAVVGPTSGPERQAICDAHRYGAGRPLRGRARGNPPRVVTSEGTRATLSYLPVLAYPPDAPGSAVHGREIFGRYCSSCHGVHGDGNGPAAGLLDTGALGLHPRSARHGARLRCLWYALHAGWAGAPPHILDAVMGPRPRPDDALRRGSVSPDLSKRLSRRTLSDHAVGENPHGPVHRPGGYGGKPTTRIRAKTLHPTGNPRRTDDSGRHARFGTLLALHGRRLMAWVIRPMRLPACSGTHGQTSANADEGLGIATTVDP